MNFASKNTSKNNIPLLLLLFENYLQFKNNKRDWNYLWYLHEKHFKLLIWHTTYSHTQCFRHCLFFLWSWMYFEEFSIQWVRSCKGKKKFNFEQRRTHGNPARPAGIVKNKNITLSASMINIPAGIITTAYRKSQQLTGTDRCD